MCSEDSPFALKVVAWLFILMGIFAVIQIVAMLMHNHVDLNFGVLGLWIGPGLLRHRRGWRTCALVFLWIGLIGIPLFMLLSLGRSSLDFKVFGIPMGRIPTVLGLCLVAPFFFLILWQYRVLINPHIRRLFYPWPDDEPEDVAYDAME